MSIFLRCLNGFIIVLLFFSAVESFRSHLLHLQNPINRNANSIKLSSKYMSKPKYEGGKSSSDANAKTFIGRSKISSKLEKLTSNKESKLLDDSKINLQEKFTYQRPKIERIHSPENRKKLEDFAVGQKLKGRVISITEYNLSFI